MESPRFERVCRTANSEGYLIVDGEDEEVVGRVDLHFTSGPVYGVLVIERDLPESDILELRREIDDEIVQTADVPRDDFLLAVYRGQPVRTEPFTDEDDLQPITDALP